MTMSLWGTRGVHLFYSDKGYSWNLFERTMEISTILGTIEFIDRPREQGRNYEILKRSRKYVILSWEFPPSLEMF